MKDIVIVGSGGFAKEVGFLIDEINKKKPQWNLLGFVDQKIGHKNGKYLVCNNDYWLENISKEIYVVFGIGEPSIIHRLSGKFIKNKNIIFPNLIHPNVIADWDMIKIGKGNIICAGNIFTTDIKIGSFNMFNLDCTIGHNVKIGSFNVINPSVNVSGGVFIENEILVGTGAQLLQNKSIKGKSVIGAGAVVTKDIKEPGVYVGSPAKFLKK